ncbi:MAG: DUF4399 domain-containing protein [Pseudomonadota bacterium]
MLSVATRTALLIVIFSLAACGQKAEQPAAAAEPAEKPADKPAAMPRSASAEGARVFFITPADGDTVESPVSIEFGIEGMAVVPAGNPQEHSGHHHLIINAELPQADMPIPANDNYIHFGDGSTSTTVELPPGEHTLQLLLGDHIHIPHDPPVTSEVITITVAGDAE